ncbi:MAG: NFACT family protein [Ruminococcus sp.]|nr:NFACT family protein [Ruminococcus sp.]
MALDGIFLRHIGKEIENIAMDAKVNQVHQPSRDELILSLHTKTGNKKILISTRADSPRVSFTSHNAENPQTAPMFCMLMRKHLCSARLCGVRQEGLERILFLDFDGATTLGDRTKITLCVEIMGKHSNCILIDSEGVIIDALKRIDLTLSSKRLVLPQLRYELPPSQGKLSLEELSAEETAERILRNETMPLDKAMLCTVTGVSPIVCRETAFRATGQSDILVSEMTSEHKQSYLAQIEKLREITLSKEGTPYILKDPTGRPFDMCFLKAQQYGESAVLKEYESFSQLLDDYYYERDSIERMRVRSRALSKLAANNISRLSRKISAQMAELEKSRDRESLRICGDLLQANLYRIEKGAQFVQVENFYDENMSTITIRLDPAKSPSQNAQRYYKDYQRAKTADKILRVQIEKGKQELEYLETVADEINRAESERELSQIRLELVDGGYIKPQKGKQKPPAEQGPREFEISDGFTLLVGRNNRQNDMLTLKLSAKNDLWLHTKDIPGSHCIIRTEGKEVTDSAVMEAAQICAWYSKARESSQVPVDFTLVRYVSKPQGSPPGRVIYTDQHTVYVTPQNPEKR